MGRLVYSSGPAGKNDPCPKCVQRPCRCPVSVVDTRPPESHAIRVRIDRSGRKGKSVTVAAPFFLSRDETLQLLKHFKQKCGCGGALKAVDDRSGRDGWVLELQGERREQVLAELAALGFPAKPSGG